MNVAIVKYDAGNVCSVVNALRRLGVEPVITDDASLLAGADRVVFPGQGEARQAMTYLRQHELCGVIKSLRQPVLGICIGMQLMCRHSEEGDTDCLSIFDADVVRFRPTRHEDKVPQMGWNEIYFNENENENCVSRFSFENSHNISPLFKGLLGPDVQGALPYMYFVHSYYVPLCEHTIAMTDYVKPYSSALHRDNFFATQFHPEKSGAAGERILRNFLELKMTNNSWN